MTRSEYRVKWIVANIVMVLIVAIVFIGWLLMGATLYQSIAWLVISAIVVGFSNLMWARTYRGLVD